MWSFGCILAELYAADCCSCARLRPLTLSFSYTGYPLFPGENEVEQLACIMEVIGVPPRHLIESSSRAKMFFDSSLQPRIVANSRGKKRRPGSRDLSTALRCTDAPFLSFLEGCLRWDSSHR
jgi:dual specificity tyrosine-phosphorylation-regulated kinase 2/3/4